MAEGVIMLRILSGVVYSGLSEWALKIITRILMREEKAMCRQRQRWERRGYKPRNVGRHQKLGERHGTGSPPASWEGVQPC